MASLDEQQGVNLCATLVAGLLWGLCLAQVGPANAVEVSTEQMLAHPEKIRQWIQAGKAKASAIPNPHWRSDRCQACHSGTPTAKQLKLRKQNIDQLCNQCHTGELDHSYVHPSNVKVKEAGMRKRMPREFRAHLNKGKLSCATCHDITAQCLASRRHEKNLNPLFFRQGPYADRTDICYKCHDAGAYQRLNAHDQVDDKGRLRKYKCLLCHASTKKLEKARSIKDVDFHVKGSLVWICASCHPVVPHPSGGFSVTRKGKEPDHLVVPPEAIRKKMQESEKEKNVIFPLDPNTGRVFCATCHNPHEKGVIKNEAAAKGADAPKRLRASNICMNCHDM